jgi:hypothetical protein
MNQQLCAVKWYVATLASGNETQCRVDLGGPLRGSKLADMEGALRNAFGSSLDGATTSLVISLPALRE